MRRIAIAFAALLALALPGDAQVDQDVLPPNTVVGRLGIGTGPAQAIPITSLRIGVPLSVIVNAACDGVTNDSVAIQALLANGGGSTPWGKICNDTVDGQNAFVGKLFGFGQVKDSGGNLRGPFMAQLNAPPSSLCGTNGIANIINAFSCDLSHTLFAVEHRVVGATTLGQPASAYVYTPNAYPYYTQVYNEAGFASNTGTGRTAMVGHMMNLSHNGQGDMVGFDVQCGMGSQTRAGARSWGDDPSCVFFNGTMGAGAAGQNLNPSEMQMFDNGFDVLGVGMNMISNRTVNTGSLGQWWGNFNSLSNGTKPIDYGYAVSGLHNIGIDLTPATFTAGNQSAIVMKVGDRVYFNGTVNAANTFASSVGTTYITYNNSTNCLQIVNNTLATVCIDSTAHIRVQGTAPALSACGTSPPAVVGSDIGGTITTGSSATTSCVMTFAVGYTNPPNCTSSPVGAANSGLFLTPAASTLTFNYTSATSQKFSYHCTAQAGG